MMVRKVAVQRPVTKVMAILPQIVEYSGMPRAIGSNPRVVVSRMDRLCKRVALIP